MSAGESAWQGGQEEARWDIICILAGLVGEACEREAAQVPSDSSSPVQRGLTVEAVDIASLKKLVEQSRHAKDALVRRRGEHGHGFHRRPRAQRVEPRAKFTITLDDSSDASLISSLLTPSTTAAHTARSRTPLPVEQTRAASASTSIVSRARERQPLESISTTTLTTTKIVYTDHASSSRHTRHQEDRHSQQSTHGSSAGSGRDTGKHEQSTSASSSQRHSPHGSTSTRTTSRGATSARVSRETSSSRTTSPNTSRTTTLSVATTSRIVGTCSSSVSRSHSSMSLASTNTQAPSSSLSQSTEVDSNGRTTVFEYDCVFQATSSSEVTSSTSPLLSSSSSTSVIGVGDNADDVAPGAFFATSQGKGTIAGISIGSLAVAGGLVALLLLWRRKRSENGGGGIFLSGRRNSSRSSVSSFGDSTTSFHDELISGQPYSSANPPGAYTQENIRAYNQMMTQVPAAPSFFVDSRRNNSGHQDPFSDPARTTPAAGTMAQQTYQGRTVPAGAFAAAGLRPHTGDSGETGGNPSSSGHDSHETYGSSAMLVGAYGSSAEDGGGHRRRASGYMSDTYRSRGRRSRPLSVRNPDSDETMPESTLTGGGEPIPSISEGGMYSPSGHTQPWAHPSDNTYPYHQQQRPAEGRASPPPPLSYIYPYYSTSPQPPSQSHFTESANDHTYGLPLASRLRPDLGTPTGSFATESSADIGRESAELQRPPNRAWLNAGIETPVDIQDVQLGPANGAGGRTTTQTLGLAGGDGYFSRR